MSAASTSRRPRAPAKVLDDTPDAPRAADWSLLAAIVLAILFLARISPWQAADLWFDEILTFDDYVLQRSLTGVFRQYPAANNHILFSALLWCWTRLLDPYLLEWLMRLPCALMSAGVVFLSVRHWRRWLGERAAFACGATFAFSLVFSAFAWQLRGYAMSMLLGAIATSGLLELLSGSTRKGLLLYLPSALLLPLAIPTNALLIAAHGLCLLIARPAGRSWPAWVMDVLLPVALAAGAGGAYYLTIWPQFRSAMAHAEGWPAAWPVVAAWGAGLAAHLGILLPLFLWQQRLLLAGASAPEPARAARDDLRLSWQLLLPVILVCGLFLAISRPAPFPRTFLVLLPTVTFAACLACRNSTVIERIHPLLLALIIAIIGTGIRLASDWQTSAALARGQHPQDLLMQYYRGRDDYSSMAMQIRRRGLGPKLALLTEFHDFNATRHYWSATSLPADHVLSTWWNKADGWQERFGTDAVLAVQAASEAHARKILAEAALPIPPRAPLVELMHAGHLTIWLVDTGQGSADAGLH